MKKQLIERALPFTGAYVFMGIHRGSMIDGETTVCANCGAILANWVEVIDQADKLTKRIGTDCAKTLEQAGAMKDGVRSYDMDIWAYNKALRVATEIRKGAAVRADWMSVYATDAKGRTIDADAAAFKTHFPELLP